MSDYNVYTSGQWMDGGVKGKETGMNSNVVLTPLQVSKLALEQLSPSFQEIVIGDYTRWCSSLIFFPFYIETTHPLGRLFVGKLELAVYGKYLDNNHLSGYYLGEYYYRGHYNDFRDFEPYTTLQIYLPFYGYVDVPIADVMNKYIEFRLNVDFHTGQAMYVIGVNNNSVECPNPPFMLGVNDIDTIILSTHIFSLGINVPLGQSGMADTIRNISMGALHGLASVAGYSLIASTGLGISSSSRVSTNIIKTRRPTDNRLTTKRKETSESVTNYDNTNYARSRAVSECFETASDSLNNMLIRPSVESPNNPFVNDNTSKSIQIVYKFAKVLDVDSSYNSLYGKPLGEVRMLSDMHGYTEVSAIHFEGNGFSNATSKELEMIENQFSNGVILSDSRVTIFSINSNIQNGVFVGNPQRFVNKGDGFTLTVDANQSYELTNEGVSVTGATFVGINKISGGDLPRYEIKFSNAVSDVKVDIILTPVGTEFPVTATITNGRILSVPVFVNRDQQFDIEVELETGYEMGNLSYSGCEFITIRQGGTKLNYTLTFGQVSGNVNIIITPKAVDYQANVSVVNGTLVGPATFSIGVGEPFSVTVDADEYHELTSGGVSVTGATFDRISESTQGTVTRYQVFFKDVTGDVAIVIRLQGKNFGLHVSITNGTVVSKPTFAQFDDEFDVVVSVNDGYTLTTNDVSVENATLKTIS